MYHAGWKEMKSKMINCFWWGDVSSFVKYGNMAKVKVDSLNF